jgi:hypothetical protein
MRVRDGWQLHLSRFVWCFLGALFLSNNEDGFRLERKVGQTGTYTSLTTVGPNTGTYTDTSV